MIRVLVIDDHAILRQGLRKILEEAGDMSVGGEAANVAEALPLLDRGGWDVILLDIAMPGRNGIEVLERMRAHGDCTPVLVLSMYPEDQYGLRLLKLGAAGYMNKESAPLQLVEAIRRIAAGKKYIGPALAELLADEQIAGHGDRPPHEALSNREYQVFLRLAAGESATAIAETMCLSVKTVSTYRARILDKLALKNNAELTRYALRYGLQ